MILWDFLFSLFVIFPILTGGVWYRSEKIYVEYTQAGIAALVLGIALYYLVKIQKKSIYESKLLSLAAKIWNKWSPAIYEEKKSPLLLAYGLVSLLWFAAALRRHLALSSGAADLGIFTSAIWNFTHGFGYISSVKDGVNLLSDHQSYLFFLFYPFFKLWPSPIVLLLLQSFGLASTSIAILKLAKQILPSRHKLIPLLPLLFWCYQPIRNANLFDFHPEVFMLPLFLFAIYFLQTPRTASRIFGTLLFLLALSAKESAAAVGVGIGFAFLFGASPLLSRSFTRKFSIFAIIASAALFVFDLKFIPQYFGATYTYSSVYGTLGPEIHQLILSPFTKPLIFFQHIFAISRLKFLLGILGPMLFLPLFSPRVFIAALPGFLMLFLADNDQRVSLGFHYGIEPAVGVLWAFLITLRKDKLLFRQKELFWALLFSSLVFFGRSEMFQIRHFTATPYKEWIRKEVLPKIHPSASLSVSSALVPQLASRNWVHFLPVTQKNDKTFVDCIIIEPQVDNSPLNIAGANALKSEVEKNYNLEFSCHNSTLMIYKNKELSESCITEKVTCPREI